MLYGILLWGKSDNVDKIAKLQKRAIYARYPSVDQLHILNHCSKHSIFRNLTYIYTLKLMKFFYKLLNDSLPAYFASYKTLIQPLTTTYPLRRRIYETFKVRHEYARICIKYQLLHFLNKLSESNSEFLDTILENVHLQPFIGYSRLITNHLVSLYRYECCIINCYVCSITIV